MHQRRRLGTGSPRAGCTCAGDRCLSPYRSGQTARGPELRMEPPVIRTGRNCDPERPLSDPSVGTSRLLSAVNSRPLTPQMAAALESWGTRFLDRVWRPDLTSDLVSRFPPGSRLVAPDQVLAERLMYAISLVAWALGRTPKHALRVEGLGGLDRAFALATAVRLLGAVPHLWAKDVRAAVAEMAVAAAAPLP